MHTHSRWLLPVLVFCLVALALPAVMHLDSGNGALSAAASGARGGDGGTADQTLALYDHATQLVVAGRDEEAMMLLADIRRLPLVVTADSGGDPAPRDIASSALMIRLGTALCARAATQAVAGNPEEAWFWALQARGVAAHVLQTRVPNLDALLAARAIDVKAGRTELEVVRKARHPEALASTLQREQALQAFYRKHVLVELAQARTRRKVSERETMARYPIGERDEALRRISGELDRQEAKLAVTLLQRYASRRMSVLAQTEPFRSGPAAAAAARLEARPRPRQQDRQAPA